MVILTVYPRGTPLECLTNISTISPKSVWPFVQRHSHFSQLMISDTATNVFDKYRNHT